MSTRRSTAPELVRPSATQPATPHRTTAADAAQRRGALAGSRRPRTGHALLRLQRTHGNRYVQQVVGRAGAALGIQAKLRLGPAVDRFEHEADRVAQQVTGDPQRSTTAGPGPAAPAMHRAGGGATDPAVDPEVQHAIESARGTGSPLPDNVRAAMEQVLGADFRSVRLHTGTDADRLTEALGARAFTTGRNIFFGRGEYRPASTDGRHVLAHELTHVAQQAAGGGVGHGVLQRKVMRFKPDRVTLAQRQRTPVEVKGEGEAQIVDDAVDQAWTEFVAGDFSGARDSYTDQYLRRQLAYNQGEPGMHPAAAAGYVIEDKATAKLPSRFKRQSVGMIAGTRPDLTVKLERGLYALMDITASDSTGHIVAKKGRWLHHDDIPFVAEVVYPSVNFADVAASKGLTDDQMERVEQLAAVSVAYHAAVEQRYATFEQDKFDQWQEDVAAAFTDLTRLTPPKRNPPTATRRDSGPFLDAVGLVVSLQGSPSGWSIDERLSYDDWVLRTGGKRVNVQAAEQVLNKIGTWRLAIVGSSAGRQSVRRVSSQGGAIRRGKLHLTQAAASALPYARPLN